MNLSPGPGIGCSAARCRSPHSWVQERRVFFFRSERHSLIILAAASSLCHYRRAAEQSAGARLLTRSQEPLVTSDFLDRGLVSRALTEGWSRKEKLFTSLRPFSDRFADCTANLSSSRPRLGSSAPRSSQELLTDTAAKWGPALRVDVLLEPALPSLEIEYEDIRRQTYIARPGAEENDPEQLKARN